jgi:hypothetical protein
MGENNSRNSQKSNGTSFVGFLHFVANKDYWWLCCCLGLEAVYQFNPLK